MTTNAQIKQVLTSWVESHHIPGGYGGTVRLPDASSDETPWSYLAACFASEDSEVYFRFLQNRLFEGGWIRAIADLTQGRIRIVFPPIAEIPGIDLSVSAAGTLVARKDATDGAVYLMLHENAVYAVSAATGTQKMADSVAEFVSQQVAQHREKMPEGFLFTTREEDAMNPEIQGWMYGSPSGLSPEEWPRHRRTGIPLAHGFTVKIPEAYRTRNDAKGRAFVALSFFHPGNIEAVEPDTNDDVRALFESEETPEYDGEDALAAAVALHLQTVKMPNPERATHLFEDVLEQTHALVWHTEASFAAPRTPFPAEAGDPDLLEEIYETLHDKETPIYRAKAGARREFQFGRPLHPMQGEEEVRGMGYQVIEFRCDVGGANFADGTAQYDLESGLFTWSC